MTRLHTWIFAVTSSVALYLLLSLDFLNLPLVSVEAKHEILTVLPWYLLISLGCYCLGNLGYGLLYFNECHDAYEELLTQISGAKDELRSKGVTVD